MRRLLLLLVVSCLLCACESESRYGLFPVSIPFVLLDDEGNNILDLDENVINEVYIQYGGDIYYPNRTTRDVVYPVELIVDDNIFVFGQFDWNAKYQFVVNYQDSHWRVKFESHTNSYFEGDPSTHVDVYVDGVLTEKDAAYGAYVLQM